MTRSYGAGSTYQRGSDGRWVGAVVVAGRRRYVYAKTEREALRKVDTLRVAAMAGLLPADGRLTVGQFLQEWLAGVEPTVKPSTFVSYEGHTRLHLAPLAPVLLARLEPRHVRALLGALLGEGLSPRTVQSVLTTLRMALGSAERDGLLPRNVARLVKGPAVPRKEVEVPPATDLKRLIAAASRYAPLWALLLGTGLRLGEALGLRWQDVDLERATLTVRVALASQPRRVRHLTNGQRLVLREPKTSAARRTVGLPGFVMDALRTQRDAQAEIPASVLGLAFTTPKGTPLDQRNVSRAFDADYAAAGIRRMRVHDLRHAAASYMIANGRSLDDVKRALGHTSIVVTSDLYSHLVPGRAAEIAEAMDRAFG